jgi:hypothetical protein
MKKNYIAPNTMHVVLDTTCILSGSGEIKSTTGADGFGGVGGSTSNDGFAGAQSKGYSPWDSNDEE